MFSTWPKLVSSRRYEKFKQVVTDLVDAIVLDSEVEKGEWGQPDDEDITDLLGILDVHVMKPTQEGGVMTDSEKKLLCEAFMYVVTGINNAKAGVLWNLLWEIRQRLEMVLDMSAEEAREYLGDGDIPSRVPKDQKEGGVMSKQVERETYEKLQKWLSGIQQFGTTCDTRKLADEALALLCLQPPEDSPLPETTAGRWEVKEADGQYMIKAIDESGTAQTIALFCTTKHAEANAEVAAAAPDLRDVAYDMYCYCHQCIPCDALRAALRKAGVKL